MMSSQFRFLFLMVIFLLTPRALSAAIIDFEDLDANSGAFVPQGYNGFNWLGDFGINSWENSAQVPLTGGTANSGSNFAWSNGGSRLTLSDSLFDIDSLWIMSRNGGSSTPTVTFEGKLNGTVIYTTSIQANDITWTEVNLNFAGIDEFTFDGVPNTNLLVDDISYNSSTIPEPSTCLILGGLIACFGLARRQRKWRPQVA